MARKTVLVCDNCGTEIDESKGAVMRINFNDARRGSKQADLCDACAGKMPGQPAARRGRRPQSAAAEDKARGAGRFRAVCEEPRPDPSGPRSTMGGLWV